jgi:hypothetical protein
VARLDRIVERSAGYVKVIVRGGPDQQSRFPCGRRWIERGLPGCLSRVIDSKDRAIAWWYVV